MICVLNGCPINAVVTERPDTTGCAVSVIDTACAPLVPPALVAVTLKLKVPVPADVPEITPVDVFKVRLGGNDPELIA